MLEDHPVESYNIDLYFPPGLPVDRDEIEEELSEVDGFEVVGAGSGESGSNLDLEVAVGKPVDEALRQVREVLGRLGVTGARIAVTAAD
ncbi:hypothetical protein ACQPZJ_29945 [Actinoplanes sp. CA-054009]